MKGLTGQRLSLERRETALCRITLRVVDHRQVRPTKQRKLARVVAVTSYDQRLRYFPRFVLRLCRPCEINSLSYNSWCHFEIVTVQTPHGGWR